jgi:predicted NBD/HSP70 family sugar kinase
VAQASRSSRAGTTALRVRSEELVLRALQRHGYAHARGFRDQSFAGLPLAKLAEIAGLSRPSVYNVQNVYGELLLEPLRLRPDIGYVVGVDFGPRHARVALADIHGQLFEDRAAFERSFELLRPPEEYLDWTAPRIDELVRAAGVEPGEVMGIGISQVAPINSSTGHPHPFGLANKAWRDVNVGDQLARRLIALRPEWETAQTGMADNDTNLSALAEHTVGSAQDVDDVLYVNWSNHVGFGLILAGEPYRGSRGYAGELGHVLIDDERSTRRRRKEEDYCPRCGMVGCLEMRIGADRIATEFGAQEEDLIRAADYVIDRVNVRCGGYNDDERLRVDDAARLLGQSVASMVVTLDPAALILGGTLGGRIHDDTALLRAFREGLEDRMMMGFAHEMEIRQPKLETSAIQGASLRVLSERLFEWAQQKVAATAATDWDTATPGISPGR